MIDKIRLKRKIENCGITIEPKILDQFEEYSKILDEWSKKISITAIQEAEDVEDKHFLDCVILAQCPEIKERVADIGSGAGFPGMVLKLCRPDIEIVLIESNNKKAAFLATLAEGLGVKAEIWQERAEEIARTERRESFDVVTARAVAALPSLAEYCLPLVKPGGMFIPMKGHDEEIKGAMNAIGTLGGKLKETKPYRLPDESERTLYLIEKVKATDERYPRNAAKIKKKPL